VQDTTDFARLRPGDAVLEVGCGAGQATVSFAQRGYRLTGLDPGDALIKVARERVLDNSVQFVNSTFESWQPAPSTSYRLIFAAQSWHWIPRELSFAKAANLLDRDGVLAVFGHVPGALAEPLYSEFEAIYRRHTGRWNPPPETGYLPSGPLVKWFDAAGRFDTVIHKSYSWDWTLTAASFTSFARTRSDHQMMPSAQLDAILGELKNAIERHGDSFKWPYETHLYVARRKW
jgi:SAM-dependent methyltransferase